MAKVNDRIIQEIGAELGNSEWQWGNPDLNESVQPVVDIARYRRRVLWFDLAETPSGGAGVLRWTFTFPQAVTCRLIDYVNGDGVNATITTLSLATKDGTGWDPVYGLRSSGAGLRAFLVGDGQIATGGASDFIPRKVLIPLGVTFIVQISSAGAALAAAAQTIKGYFVTEPPERQLTQAPPPAAAVP